MRKTVDQVLGDPHLSPSFRLSWLKAQRSQLRPQDADVCLGFLRTLRGRPLHLRIARGYALEPALPFVELYLRIAGFEPRVELGAFGQWRQELAQSSTQDLLWLAVRLEDLLPGLTERAWEAERGPGGPAPLPRGGRRPLALTRFVAPPHPHPQLPALARRLNQLLDEALGPAVVWVDLEKACSEVGWRHAFDYRFDAMARIPYTPPVLMALARELAAAWLRRCGRSIKCIVSDGDNTMWGGIAGELGAAGVALGDTFPGSAFKDFQRVLLHHHRQGVMLALNTRNDPEVVHAILRDHPHQVLRQEHFLSLHAHWEDKADHLERIARELDIGLDSLLFVDDDPRQCARVSTAHPQVLVVQQSDSPLQVPFALSDIDELQAGELTSEDRGRNQMMQDARRRTQSRERMTVESFEASLGSVAELYIDHAPHVTRAVQLLQTTNQFHCSGWRPGPEDVRALLHAPFPNLLATCSLRDCFGDLGLVGVGLVRVGTADGPARLENLAISCRALGRGLETAFLRHLLEHCKNAGLDGLHALWRPLPRNQQTESFFPRHGFRVVSESPEETVYAFSFPRRPAP